jgi:hypothetical protein
MTTILAEYEANGTLSRFVPLFDPDERETRRLFMTRSLKAYIEDVQGRAPRGYQGKIRAALGEFVKGEEIPDDETVLKKLRPFRENIWAIRITFDPQSRLFGAFAGFDTFVGFHGRLRQNCDDGGFAEACRTVDEGWKDLFGLWPRQRARELRHLISNVG